jgi:hypothetical protein
MSEPRSYLLDLAGLRIVLEDGTELPVSAVLNFKGAISATYNAATRQIDVDAAGGGSGRYSIQDGTDANTTASANVLLRMPTCTAARNVSLPASPTDGDFVKLKVTNATACNITVLGNGHNINDGFSAAAASDVVAIDGAYREYVFSTTQNEWMRIL